jgi:hypothetical protein
MWPLSHSYLLKLHKGRMQRCYFELDCKGALAYHSAPGDATRLLLPVAREARAAGEGEGGRDGGSSGGDGGILLPIAQGAMSHAWGYLTGRRRNVEGVRGLSKPTQWARGYLSLGVFLIGSQSRQLTDAELLLSPVRGHSVCRLCSKPTTV